MLVPLIRSHPVGGGTPIVTRRNTPEILLPDSSTPGIKTLGTNDVLTGVYTQVVAATALQLAIIGGYFGYRAGIQTAAGVGGTFLVQRQGRIRLGRGAAGAETRIAEFRFAGNLTVQVNNPGATTTVVAVATPGHFYQIGPILLPAGTRLAYDGAINDALTANQSRLYLAGYDPATANFITLNKDYLSMLQGGVATDTVVTDYTVLNRPTGAWVNSGYTTLPIKGAATADADYLVVNLFAQDWTQVMCDNQFDLAVGAAGSEVIQARVASPGASGFQHGPFDHELFVPFLLYAGERLSCRVRGSSAIADACDVTCTMIRL